MPDPLVATPTRDSNATCGECGSTLVRTGKESTFSEGDAPRGYRGWRQFKGWVPALLVSICPVCDVRKAPDVVAEPKPKRTRAPKPVLGVLERIAAAEDKRKAKEKKNDA